MLTEKVGEFQTLQPSTVYYYVQNISSLDLYACSQSEYWLSGHLLKRLAKTGSRVPVHPVSALPTGICLLFSVFIKQIQLLRPRHFRS